MKGIQTFCSKERDKKGKFLIVIVMNQKIIFEIDYLRGSHIHVLFRNMEVNTGRKLFNYLKY